jgi:SAM-dependent methyltransferase
MIHITRSNFDWIYLIKTYKKYVTRESVVLEIGASNIDRTKELSEYCNKIIGVEYFKERLPENFLNVEYIHGDWQNLSDFIESESIDIVVASHVIEHIPDDLKAINELYTILKPGGVSILNTPNKKRLTRSIIEFFTEERKFPHWEHVREYTENDLIILLNRSKFNQYKISPLVIGLHGGPIHIYWDQVPLKLKRYANYWQINLYKCGQNDKQLIKNS